MIGAIEQQRLVQVAERVRASSSLGRSDMLRRLFDYLLERTLTGSPPKEIEIASDIFGRTDTDLAVDASVRVYIHRLRRKLEDFYSGPGREDEDRLILPKGEYRFALADRSDDPVEDATSAVPVRRFGSERVLRWLFLALGLVAGATLAFGAMRAMQGTDALAGVRATQIWSPFLASPRPLTIVTGDYYIMGERDAPDRDPARLVREYGINSPEDLYQTLMYRPELRDQYVDLNLYYLPVSTAYALKTVMPIVAPVTGGGRTMPLVPSSQLSPPTLKNNDIIYVGLLSALGSLQAPVLSGSRFSFGGSYDEIIDGQTGKIYISDPPEHGQAQRRNYAYVALLPGPDGSHIMIIAGTRDPAVLQAADILADPKLIETLGPAIKGGYFEAIYAVEGVGGENLRGTLIAAGPRTGEDMWEARR